MGQRWTLSETTYLKNNYKNFSFIEISIKLNRTHKAVRNKSQRMGIKRGFKRKNNGNWKGGKCKDRGYILLTGKFDCPYSNKRGIVFEHIYNYYISFPLDKIKKGEVIHHRDLNKSNNNSGNLIKLKNGEHIKLHAKIRREVH